MRIAIGLPAAAGVLLLLAHLLPVPQNGQLAGIPTICPFKVLTTIPCPGCGLTRALVLFAHGDWAQAIAFHPLAPIFYAALWLALIAGVLQMQKTPPSISPRFFVLAGSSFAASLLILWVARLTGIIPFPANF